MDAGPASCSDRDSGCPGGLEGGGGSGTGGRLVLDRAEEEDSGWYQCAMDYEGEEYTSVAYYLNVIPREDDQDELDQEENLEVDRKEEQEKTRFKASANDSSSSSDARLMDRVVVYEEGHEVSNCSSASSSLRPPTSASYLSPTIAALNSSSVIRLPAEEDSSDPVVAAFAVCSNPSADRVLWATPVHALRPGSTAGHIRAAPLIRSEGNVTCLIATLELSSPSAPPGEYVLVASNRFGAAVQEFTVVGGHKSGELTSGARPTTTSTAFTLLAMMLVLPLRL